MLSCRRTPTMGDPADTVVVSEEGGEDRQLLLEPGMGAAADSTG